jgi:hypothetical protein
MTEPSASRPLPGPARPVPGPAGRPTAPDAGQDRFGDLEGRPVAEHVEVFEAEHDRLQSELGTIDRV